MNISAASSFKRKSFIYNNILEKTKTKVIWDHQEWMCFFLDTDAELIHPTPAAASKANEQLYVWQVFMCVCIHFALIFTSMDIVDGNARRGV